VAGGRPGGPQGSGETDATRHHCPGGQGLQRRRPRGQPTAGARNDHRSARLRAPTPQEERHRDGKGKWAAVSREVGRPRGACRQQWNRAFGAEASSKRRGHWDGEEEAALRDAVAAQSSEEPSAVSWVRVAEAVSTRSSRECWEKWHRTSFGAEAEGRRWTAEHDAALVAALAEEDADTWSGEATTACGPHRQQRDDAPLR